MNTNPDGSENQNQSHKNGVGSNNENTEDSVHSYTKGGLKRQDSDDKEGDAKKLSQINYLTNKGTLVTYNGKEIGITSTFNHEWKEIITKFV